MLLIKQIQEKYPELRDPLADVWNLLLDHRGAVIKAELPDELLDTLSLRQDFALVLSKDVTFDQNNMIVRIRNANQKEM